MSNTSRSKISLFIKAKLRLLLLLITMICSGIVCSQDKKPPKPKKEKIPRLERKALHYEDLIRRKKREGARLLDEKTVNYTKLKKLKTKIEKLSSKVEKCRYKLKSIQHIKMQDRATKRRMKKSLKKHRKYKANRRNRN